MDRTRRVRQVPLCGLLLTVLAMFLAGGAARCDSWGPFTPVHRSGNGAYCLRVEWRDRTSRPRLSLEEKAPNGFILVWKVESPQDLPPHAAFIADNGSSVVLRDQWSQLGSGTVLAFLDADGKSGRSYSLGQILSKDEELDSLRSVSSVQWADYGAGFFCAGARQFAQLTATGTTLAFRLPTGEPVKLTPDDERAIWQERARVVRPRLNSKDGDTRANSASLLGMLRDNASIAALKILLDDPEKHAIGVSQNDSLKSGNYDFYDVQSAAGDALSLIIGDAAVPLFHRKLATANPLMRQTWLNLIIRGGGPLSRKALRQLALGRPGPERDEVMLALLQVNDQDFVRRHRELLHSGNESLRSLAAYTFSETAQKGDVASLEKLIWNKDQIVSIWAYRGVRHLNPRRAATLAPRLPTHLKEYFAAERREGQRAAQQPAAVVPPLNELAALRRHTHSGFRWGDEEREANRLCRRLVAERPAGLETALRQAAFNPCAEIRRITAAALAVLGDAKSETVLRKWCNSTEPYYRADSLRWLALCQPRPVHPRNHSH